MTVHMTLVFDALPLAVAGVGYLGWQRKVDDQKTAEQIARDIYQRVFVADLPDAPAEEKINYLYSSLPSEIDQHAKASIFIIEEYQKGRKTHVMGFAISRHERTDDTKTIVLEDLKQRLSKITTGNVSAEHITPILDCCRLFMLQQTAFAGSNENSFLSTMAQLCKQLEMLIRQAKGNQRDCADNLQGMLDAGRALLVSVIPVLIFGLSKHGRATSSPPDQVDVSSLLRAAVSATSQETQDVALNWSTDCGNVIKVLLCSKHVHMLMGGLTKKEQESLTTPVEDSIQPDKLTNLLNSLRNKEWKPCPSQKQSGLLKMFCDETCNDARSAYLDLIKSVDRVAYFLHTMVKAFQELAGKAGDVVMCALYDSVNHVLQELGSALFELRQARLQVMRAAKCKLQELAQRYDQTTSIEKNWMQGLRHIDESKLDSLHNQLLDLCNKVRNAVSPTHVSEMKAATAENLRGIRNVFKSEEFQMRCTRQLSRGTLAEINQPVPALLDR